MEERKWKLGEDIGTNDNLLDQVTFDDLILTCHCNCKEITVKAVYEEPQSILESRLEDCLDLLDINIAEIIRLAKDGRETE